MEKSLSSTQASGMHGTLQTRSAPNIAMVGQSTSHGSMLGIQAQECIESSENTKLPTAQDFSSSYGLDHDDDTFLQPSPFCNESTEQDHKPIIIFLGKTGAGKIEVVRHIFKDSAHNLPEYGSAHRQNKLVVYDDCHDLIIDDKIIAFRVIIMEYTKGLMSGFSFSSNILQQISDFGPVSAVFFVLKYGRVTIEDCQPFKSIIKGFQNEGFKHICHLIITGCEGQDKAGRESVIRLYKRDSLTSSICFGVHNILPVGFPDLTFVTMPELKELYKECIQEDEDKLKHILKTVISNKPMQLMHVMDLNSIVADISLQCIIL